MASTNTLENEIKNSIASQTENQTLGLNEQLAIINYKLASLQAEIREIKSQKMNVDGAGGEIILGILNQGFTNESMKNTEVNNQNEEPLKMEKNPKETSAYDTQSYAEGLTVHGLSRIATGGPRAQVIWSLLIVTSFIIAIIISIEHWDAFLDHDSQTSTKIVSQEEMALPAITFCTWQELVVHRRRFVTGKPIFQRPDLVEFGAIGAYHCASNLTKCGYNGTTFLNVHSTLADYEHSSPKNNLVIFDNTTNCFTVSGEIQTVPSYVLSVQMVAERISGVNEWTEMYINHPSETFPQASAVYWAAEGFYHVYVEKKIIKRLGLPYTDCVEGSGTYKQNKFTGNYTVNKCLKGCFFEEVFKRCGAIPIMYKKHLRKPEIFDNKTEINETFASVCLYSVERDYALTAKCNAQCRISRPLL